MPSNYIHPRYRLLVRYDIRPEMVETYQQYVLSEFIPALQNVGVYVLAAWHIAYGDYPMRQVEFVSEDLETVQQLFASADWQEMEDQLKSYTTHYERKLVRYRDGFQI